MDCPGEITETVPPHWQWHCETAVSTGRPLARTEGEAGDQAAVMRGTQGEGPPRYVGLAEEEHMPNGLTFAGGWKSWSVATGWPPATGRPGACTASGLGVDPMVQ